MIHTIFLLRIPWDRLRQLFNDIYCFYLFIFGCIGSSLLHTDSGCRELGPLSVVVSRLLVAVVSLLAERWP